MANFPEGFNSWDKDVQLSYIVAASEVQKAVAASEAQKAASEAQSMKYVVKLEIIKRAKRKTSIGKADAVFLFFLVHGDTYEVSGTAFAISETLVFAAYHCFSVKGGGHHLHCAISSKATKVDGLLTPLDDCVALELLQFDEGDDWALFRRCGDGAFSTILPICPQAELPIPSSDVVIQQYYYSLGLLLNSTITDACIWSDSTCLLQYDCGGKFAILKRGKTAGSSGSPAVTSDGRVFGMHLESFNESPDFDASGAGGGLLPPAPPTKMSRLTVEGDAAMECASDLSGLSDLSYANYSRCLVLAAIPRLMEAVLCATAGHSGGGSGTL